MSLYKRKGAFYCDFAVNGQRYRQTLETTDRREAIQKECDLIAQAKEGKLATGATAEFSRLLFGAALDRYLAERGIQVAEIRWETRLTKRLRPFFAAKRLNQISADDIRQYQAHRLGQGRHPNTVNHEVKALLRPLKRAKLASRIRDDVKLLPAKREPRKALTQAEKQKLFETAASKPEDWQVAYCAALLTTNTSMRPCELRRLKWIDLDPENRIVIVRRSKTEAGTRVIPLNDEAWSAMCALRQRAEALGTDHLEHYILPRMLPAIDGTQPMGVNGWKTAWRSLRVAAGVPRLTFYSLRHQFVTELCEAGVPESVIRELAGYVDPQMMRLYSHPRLAAKRAAVEALATVKTGQLEGSYVTNHVTKALPEHVLVS